jgi:hypothetical protein
MRNIPIFRDFDPKNRPIGELKLEEKYAKELERQIWKGRIISGLKLGFTVVANEDGTSVTIVSAHDTGIYPSAIPAGSTNAVYDRKTCGGTITFPATEKSAEMSFPVSSFEITVKKKEKAMETLVEEVFEKIVDSVSKIMFGAKGRAVAENEKELIRLALADIPSELRRLADDTQIRAGSKT